MSAFQLTTDAENDLNLIWEFIAQDNIDAANRVIDKLEKSTETLATMPEMAQPRPKLSKIPTQRCAISADFPTRRES